VSNLLGVYCKAQASQAAYPGPDEALSLEFWLRGGATGLIGDSSNCCESMNNCVMHASIE
jgi:hypothetical protein